MSKSVNSRPENPYQREDDTQFKRTSIRSSDPDRRHRRSDRHRDFNPDYRGPYRRYLIDRREGITQRRDSSNDD